MGSSAGAVSAGGAGGTKSWKEGAAEHAAGKISCGAAVPAVNLFLSGGAHEGATCVLSHVGVFAGARPAHRRPHRSIGFRPSQEQGG
jgi:hypothetical protein